MPNALACLRRRSLRSTEPSSKTKVLSPILSVSKIRKRLGECALL